MSKRKRFGYMDATDYLHELGEAAGATHIYGSVKEVLKYQPCAAACGVVKVEVLESATEIANDFDREVHLTEKDREEKNALFVAQTKLRVAHYEILIEGLKRQVARNESFVAALKAELAEIENSRQA